MSKGLSATMSTSLKHQATHNSAPSDLKPNDEYFNFTRGRFVFNEGHEMSQRYIHFDVPALARVAAEAVGSQSCVHIKKYPDGMYNKALLLTMNDGSQVVAKIPNPNAGQPHFTIASEVATMDFVRNILGTPAPKVYAWSSRTHENKVGAEYIIMEKVPGVPLDDVWRTMGIEDRFKIVKTIASYQKAWTSTIFNQYGSLYYSKDLDTSTSGPLYTDSHGDTITNTKFSVGPSTGREFNDDGRAAVKFDRGPWKSLVDYQVAIGRRESICIRELSRLPKSPITVLGTGTYQPTREKKLKALEYYLSMIKYLIPTDQSIHAPCLWHGDLHVENILVNPENHTEIVGIIDWQSTELAPLFGHARPPGFLDHSGPPAVGLERPRLPENLAQLDPDAQKRARALFRDQSLVVLYKTLISKRIPRLYKAMIFRETTSFDLLQLAQNILVDGEAAYLGQVMMLEEEWNELPGVRAQGGVPFPFQFSAEEKAEIEEDAEAANFGIKVMRDVHESVGEQLSERGFVRREHYEEVKDALRQVKEQVIQMFRLNESQRVVFNEHWPYD
ncbi:MAG: hypothetical protein M1836_008204 [Candelina mexicana]|nr:MAG: hypothetical protein M1836_008204 [Candelina mexicana]